MSIDELKRGFDRLAESVVPADDPFGRLMQRSRRRWRAQAAKVSLAVAAIIASAVAAGVVLQGTDSRGGSGFQGWVVTSDWTWRLINSPTRGDLAENAAFISGVLAFEHEYVNDNLPHTKVLFAGNVGTRTVALVARYSDTRAVLDSQSAPQGTSEWSGGLNGALAPVVALTSAAAGDESAQWTLVLAPDGCETSTGVGSYTGTHERTWQPAPTGDWLVTEDPSPYLQVTCAGRTRQQGPAVPITVTETAPPAPVTSPREGATGAASLPATYLADLAVATFGQLVNAMHRSTGAHVAWTGRLPGDPESGQVVLVVGDGPNRPALLLIAGIEPTAMVALEPPRYVSSDEGPAENQSGLERWSLVSTGSSGEGDLVALRVPQRAGGHAQLSERVLAVTPAAAVRLEALDHGGDVVARADVADRVAVLTFEVAAAASIRAVDGNGTTVAAAAFVEPASGARVFNEQIINNW